MGQLLDWDVTVIEIDADVSVFHFDVAADSRIRHDLLVFLLRGAALNLVAIEHRVGRDVFKRWLESAGYHHVLLHHLDVTLLFIWTRQFLFFVNWNRIEAIMNTLINLKLNLLFLGSDAGGRGDPRRLLSRADVR